MCEENSMQHQSALRGRQSVRLDGRKIASIKEELSPSKHRLPPVSACSFFVREPGLQKGGQYYAIPKLSVDAVISEPHHVVLTSMEQKKWCGAKRWTSHYTFTCCSLADWSELNTTSSIQTAAQLCKPRGRQLHSFSNITTFPDQSIFDILCSHVLCSVACGSSIYHISLILK